MEVMMEEEDEDAAFLDDPVYQSIKLLNAHLPVPPQVTARVEQLVGPPEKDLMSEFIIKLESDKRNEIEQITRELDHEKKRRVEAEKKLLRLDLLHNMEKNTQHRILEKLTCDMNAEVSKRVEAEEKLSKLVEFITFVNGEVGKLITSLVSMATKNVNTGNILNIGPFGDEKEADEFLEMLKDLSRQFQKDAETSASDLMDKASHFFILRNGRNPPPPPVEKVVVSDGQVTKNHVQKVSSSDYVQIMEIKETSGNVQKRNVASFISTTATITPPLLVLDDDLTDLIGVFSPVSSQEQLGFKKRRKRLKNNLSTLVKGESPLDLASFNKKHGVDHSKRHWGHYCLCGIKQRNQSSLNFHIKYFTAERKFKCDMCSKGFVSGGLLRSHLLSSHKIIDLGIGKVTCSGCTQDFQSRKELRAHQKTSCSSFPPEENNDITKERLVATNNKSSNQYDGMLSWKLNDSSTQPIRINSKSVFRCSICSKGYKYFSVLKRHYQSAHNLGYELGKHACSACGQFFESKAQVRHHRKVAHANESEKAVFTSTTSASGCPPPDVSCIDKLPNDCTVMETTPIILTPTSKTVNLDDDNQVICID